MFLTLKVHQKVWKDKIDEVSELKNSYRKSVHVNIQQVDGNSKRKYPNKNFKFHISNFTKGINDISRRWPTPRYCYKTYITWMFIMLSKPLTISCHLFQCQFHVEINRNNSLQSFIFLQLVRDLCSKSLLYNGKLWRRKLMNSHFQQLILSVLIA